MCIGVVAQQQDLVISSLGSGAALLITQKMFDWAAMHCREWILGLNLGRLDQRATELFFEKSLGQHLSEANTLTASNLENARGRVWTLQSMILFDTIPALAHLVVAYALLWWIHWVSGVLVTVALALHLWMTVFLNQRVMSACGSIEKGFRARDRYRGERWQGIERVKTNDRAQDEIRHLDAWFGELIVDDRRLYLWFLRMVGRRDLVSSCIVVAVFFFGVFEVLSGRMALGMLYPLFVWSSALRDNLWRIGHIEFNLNHHLASIQSMKEALTLPPDIVDHPDAVDVPEGPLHVEMRGVSYGYPSGEIEDGAVVSQRPRVPILRCVDLVIHPGEKVALMGLSGAGKTTIMRHVLRYMDPQEGGIMVNGVDLRCIRQASWLSMIAYVPQEAKVFDGTLRDNLLYGLAPEQRKTVTDEVLWQIMRLMRMDLGARLTDGLQTRVGRRGLKLSGGAQQRLMIAAAAIRRPRLMVIDEATSNLDSTTERAVQEGIARVLGREIGALIITHRLSTVRHLCNRFVVLQSAAACNGHGQVEAVASSFEELHGMSPTFRRLAQDQGVSIS